jgi:hypothetical protein
VNKKPEIPFLQFPPYGIMTNVSLKELGSKNLLGSPTDAFVPPHFQSLPNEDDLQRERRWLKFRDNLIAEMADVLWPVWNQQSRSWKGCAIDRMLELTRADLEILLLLRAGPRPLHLDAPPDSPVRILNCPPHSTFFAEEDAGKIFNSYAFYDRNLDGKNVSASIFSDLFFTGLDAKCGSADLQFKQFFQRPRPFQMAFLMGETNFNLERATSSMTPSMISGHSLQGLIGVGAVMEQILQSGIPFDSDSWTALSQYAVDIGDRRVFAGIHYPSDNLSSWIVLMRLANFIYRSHKVKSKLWTAITERSLVYRLIDNQKGTRVYSAPLKLLRQLAESD